MTRYLNCEDLIHVGIYSSFCPNSSLVHGGSSAILAYPPSGRCCIVLRHDSIPPYFCIFDLYELHECLYSNAFTRGPVTRNGSSDTANNFSFWICNYITDALYLSRSILNRTTGLIFIASWIPCGSCFPFKVAFKHALKTSYTPI